MVNVGNVKLHVISYNVGVKEKVTGKKLDNTYYIGTTLSKKNMGLNLLKKFIEIDWM